MRLLAVSLTATALVATCKPSAGQIDCDTEIQYNARKVEGSVNVGKFGGSVDTEVKAVHQIDQVVERYMSRWKSLCKEYNAGVHTKEQYRTETRALRQKMEEIDALLIKLDNAPDSAAYQLALKEMYSSVVPDGEQSGMDLALTVAAAPPGSKDMQPIRGGATLKSGSNVYFSVRPSAQAYVYLYQQDASGGLSILFPHEGIPMQNPIAQEVRIPPAPAVFTLNDKDIGLEHVYVVGSTERIPELETAMKGEGVTVQALNCAARALELNAGGECEGARGLELSPGGGGGRAGAQAQGASLEATSAAGDNRIVQVFSFEHTR